MKAIWFHFTEFFSAAKIFDCRFFLRQIFFADWKYTRFSTFFDEFFAIYYFEVLSEARKIASETSKPSRTNCRRRRQCGVEDYQFLFLQTMYFGKNPTGKSILGSSRMSWSNPVRKLPIEITQCARDFWRFAYLPLKIRSDIVARLKNHWDWTC